MPKTIIYYLSVLPGVGKTTWAISEMANRMENRNTITLYVAPSIMLLNQVKTDLELELTDRGTVPKFYKYIKFIESDPRHGHLSTWVPVAEQLRLALEGGKARGYEGNHQPKMPLGSIIFLTHEAFLKRQNIDKTNVSVIFDEARKFVTTPEQIMLKSPDEEKWFSDLLKKDSEQLVDRDGNITEFNKVMRAKIPKNLNAELNSTNSRIQYNAILTITSIIKNPDIDLYVSEGARKWGRTKFRFHQVVIPSNIFVGFQEVILMSAFLKDSQMWHLLRPNPDVVLYDMQRIGPYKEAINELFYSRANKIFDKFELITIIPLTRQQELVSLTRYNNGILIPEIAEFVFKTALEKEGYSKTHDVQYLMANYKGMDLNKKQKRVMAAVDKYGAVLNVFDWYCKLANKVVDNIRRWGKLKKRPLAVANKKYGLDAHIETHYPNFRVIPTQSAGMNEYKGHNCIFFSAAINPSRESTHLYNALLPDYDFALDHVAEACVQCVTRLSIRDTKSTDRVYVIVPDLAMANLLYSKLSGRPNIDTRVANKFKMTAFNNLNPERVNKIERPVRTEKEKTVSVKVNNKKWQEENREIVRLRNKRNYYRNVLKVGDSEEYKSKLQQIEKELAACLLRKNRKTVNK